MTRQGIALPIIVLTVKPPDAATVAAIRAAGGGTTHAIPLGNGVATTATLEAARQIANLPQVKEVWPDEPTIAL